MPWWKTIPPFWRKISGWIIVLLVLYLAYRFYFKDRPEQTEVDEDKIPGVGGQDGGQDGAQWDPEPLSTDLYNSMKGVNVHLFEEDPRAEPWRKLADLQANSQVKLVYNHFNREYGGGASLTEWIKGEYADPWERAAVNKEDALARLNKLGLE